MADAEKLLHEAQYAFASITFGESLGNTRNRARARKLSMKILKQFPNTMYAQEAHSILMRLGDEAFTSEMPLRHQHISQERHHQPKPAATHKHISQKEHHWPERAPRETSAASNPVTHGADSNPSRGEAFDWAALIAALFRMPKIVLGVFAFVALFVYGILGPWLFLPLAAFFLVTGPFRGSLDANTRRQVEEFNARMNAMMRSDS